MLVRIAKTKACVVITQIHHVIYLSVVNILAPAMRRRKRKEVIINPNPGETPGFFYVKLSPCENHNL